MAEYHHFVHFTIVSNDWLIRPVFTCSAADDDPCRQLCQTCHNEHRDCCECAGLKREPDIRTGEPCSYITWMEVCDGAVENYDGPECNVRGPEPAPVVFSWQGDYYTWEYAKAVG